MIFSTKNMDQNKNLLCCNNGVVDFENKGFRDGLPEDYITKCSLIDYVEYDGIEAGQFNAGCCVNQYIGGTGCTNF